MSHRVRSLVALGFLLVLAGCQSQSDLPRDAKVEAADRAPTNVVPNQQSGKSAATRADEELAFEKLVYGKMQRRVAWHLSKEKFGDFVKRLRKELGVNVVVDQRAMEETGVDVNDLINQDLGDVTLDVALDLVLRQLALDWTLVGNAVLISDGPKVEASLTTRVYDVGDLIDGGNFANSEVDSLVDAIVSTVFTDTWAENGGGQAEIRPLRVRGQTVLVVSQTRRAHHGIRQLLSDLRSVPRKTPRPGRPPANEAELREKIGVLQGMNAAVRPQGDRSAPIAPTIDILLPQSNEMKDAARRNNQFSLDLFRNVARDASRNELLSGYSAREALQMVALGAKGETEAELAKILRLPNDRMKSGVEALSLRSYVNGAKTAGGVFDVANSIWVKNDLKLKSEYASHVEELMGATARSLDFRRSADAVAAINAWAADKTGQRIPEILKANDVSAQTYFVLVNATYFLGKWQTQFDAENTKPGNFTLADGKVVQVEMMNGNMLVNYASDNRSGLQIAELPYRDKTKSLVVLLPPEGKAELTKLLRELDADKLEEWIAATKRGDVHVRLPKFKFQARHDLNEPLTAMGGSRIFNLETADFSGIANGPLALQIVVQQAFIKVDESGTEAAAVTAGGGFGGPRSRVPTPELTVDRPFLVLIRDVTTGCILFVGQVADPRASE